MLEGGLLASRGSEATRVYLLGTGGRLQKSTLGAGGGVSPSRGLGVVLRLLLYWRVGHHLECSGWDMRVGLSGLSGELWGMVNH